jgi:hypothetical protein
MEAYILWKKNDHISLLLVKDGKTEMPIKEMKHLTEIVSAPDGTLYIAGQSETSTVTHHDYDKSLRKNIAIYGKIAMLCSIKDKKVTQIPIENEKVNRISDLVLARDGTLYGVGRIKDNRRFADILFSIRNGKATEIRPDLWSIHNLTLSPDGTLYFIGTDFDYISNLYLMKNNQVTKIHSILMHYNDDIIIAPDGTAYINSYANNTLKHSMLRDGKVAVMPTEIIKSAYPPYLKGYIFTSNAFTKGGVNLKEFSRLCRLIQNYPKQTVTLEDGIELYALLVGNAKKIQNNQQALDIYNKFYDTLEKNQNPFLSYIKIDLLRTVESPLNNAEPVASSSAATKY